MKAFITGVNGQLGFDTAKYFVGKGVEVVASDITERYSGMQDAVMESISYIKLDITKASDVLRVIIAKKPEVIVHCAAYTAVDAAEEAENSKIAYEVNVKGTENIAKAAQIIGAKMLYISTDYVFEGIGEQPYEADCKNFAPQSVYGRTKLEGERLVSQLLEKFFIVRIAWVFGINGKNFVKTMLALSEKYDTLRVVCDQIGTPTYTGDLAPLLFEMAQSDQYGFYHATNEGGFISWYTFALEIFKLANRRINVLPVTTSEYGVSKAKRPFNSRLDKSKLTQKGFSCLPTWKDALDRYIKLIDC